MANTVIRVYDDFAAAQQARAALLHAGFGEASVQLTTHADEAGPACANVALPRKARTPDAYRARKGFFGNLFAGRAGPDSRARQDRPQQIAWHGSYLLMVDAGDDAQRAAAIMNQFGALDVEQRAANRSRIQ